MPVRSVLYLPVKPGRQRDLVAVFARIDVLGHAMRQTGCLGVEVQMAPDDPDAPLLVTALWADRASYEGWLANPWRAESAAELAPCLRDEPGAGAVYDVVLATNPELV
jgi:heme-degrading monooxygenase HmoA